jgi:transcriptional regulator with XRE-family HTH domain
MMGTSQNQIYRYEQDKNSPTGDVIIALARALGTSADWLLGMTDITKPFAGEPNLNDLEREAIQVLRTKTLDAQRKALEVLRIM